ncbi:hypothetical protein [Spiroplasma endosymbiont of Panorpa germanica]|uniref:hypothetical protein n=1 Tax=Spiroplasma endosymbiont of Panorpa germanica TaxID=3066314 RepID=UPI0030D0133B
MDQNQLFALSGLILSILISLVFLFFWVNLYMRLLQVRKLKNENEYFVNVNLKRMVLIIVPVIMVLLLILITVFSVLFLRSKTMIFSYLFQFIFLGYVIIMIWEIILISKKGNSLEIVKTANWLILVSEIIEIKDIVKVEFDFQHKNLIFKIKVSETMNREVKVSYIANLKDSFHADLRQ